MDLGGRLEQKAIVLKKRIGVGAVDVVK